jgi:hypothetical protein
MEWLYGELRRKIADAIIELMEIVPWINLESR